LYGNSQLTGPSIADFIDKTARQQKVHQGKISTQKEILIHSALALVTLSACLVPTYAPSQCPHPKHLKTKQYGEDALPFHQKQHAQIKKKSVYPNRNLEHHTLM